MLCLEWRIPPLPEITTVNHAVWTAGMQHFERNFAVFDVILVEDGAMYMEEDGEKYAVESGNMLVLEAGKTHTGYRPTETETSVYWFHFVHPEPPRQVGADKINWPQPLPRGADADVSPQPSFLYLPKFSEVAITPLRPHLDRMVELNNNLSLKHSIELHARFAELLARLQQGIRREGPVGAARISERVAAYLQRNLLQPFRAADMERELHYHFDYLSRCLKQYTGMSPLQYRHHLQVEQAKRLLVHTRLAVREVGSECGFQDVNYFVRLFRKSTGMTPGAYRSAYQVFG